MDIELQSIIDFAVYQGYRPSAAKVAQKMIERLEERDRLLTHLEERGVDNWEGYSIPRPSQESVS